MIEFDFDTFSELARRDQAAFDAARRTLLRQALEESGQPALCLELQCAIDLMRIGSPNRMETLLKLSRMSDDLSEQLRLLTVSLGSLLESHARSLIRDSELRNCQNSFQASSSEIR